MKIIRNFYNQLLISFKQNIFRHLNVQRKMNTDKTNIVVDIKDLRKPYYNEEEPFLFEKNMNNNPFLQFDIWFKNLLKHQLKYEEINAVALSTCCNNKPSSRMVLLKEYSENGFSFFTHSISRKSNEFTQNPNASMLFYWPVVNRQIRIEGKIELLNANVAEEYWRTRPLSSRIGSKLSPQSSEIPSRKFLEDKQLELEKLALEKGESAITKPDTWLGYILKPIYFEFWQGQSNRIHDRLIYVLNKESNKWILKRLAP